ncbi:transposase family protein [Streptomyces phaeochromogenes]|uniref:transposase family protein n=1 Tax=Streptomyces phaeochromogenes TaxID=1923 RepID=UPI00386EAA5D
MCRQPATVCLVKSPTCQHRAIGPLAERLRALADPRCRRGKRHTFVAVLLIPCSAVVTGARSFVAISEWAAKAPQHVHPEGPGRRTRHPPLHRPGRLGRLVRLQRHARFR